MPPISAFGKLRQEDHKFKTSLGYVVRTCFKRKKKSKSPPPPDFQNEQVSIKILFLLFISSAA
jgi:hypothetical protein